MSKLPPSGDVAAWVSRVHDLGLLAVPTWGQGKNSPFERTEYCRSTQRRDGFRDLADRPSKRARVVRIVCSGGLPTVQGTTPRPRVQRLARHRHWLR